MTSYAEPSHSEPQSFTAPGIRCAALTRDFGDVRAVDDLSFDVPMGSITGFIGANGAGKTTTLRMLLGLVAPTSGEALIAGRPIRDIPNPCRVVGAVLDAPGAHPGHTGRAHLEILASACGVDFRRVDEVLDLVELSAHARRRIGGYSLGMRQRLALAGAMIGQPHILLLDEPTQGLDPPGIVWLRTFLRGLADKGRCLLVSSHHLLELEAIVDRIVILHRGRLVAHGPIDELLRGRRQAVLVRTPNPDAFGALIRSRDGELTPTPEGGLLVAGFSEAEIGELAAAAGITLHHVSAVRSELEDLFVELTAAATPAAVDPSVSGGEARSVAAG